jgi:hypothetical protein
VATETEKEAKPAPKAIASGLAFSGICNVRNTEAHLRWLGAQVSFFLNLPAFAGAVFRLVAKLEVPELVAIAIGGFLLVGANEFLRQFINAITS